MIAIGVKWIAIDPWFRRVDGRPAFQSEDFIPQSLGRPDLLVGFRQRHRQLFRRRIDMIAVLFHGLPPCDERSAHKQAWRSIVTGK